MGLIMTAPQGSYELLPEGIYPAVCYMVADIGEQYNKKYDKWTRKVIIGWEIQDEFVTNEAGEQQPRTIHGFYSQSTHENSQIRQMLENWRCKRFSEDEIKAFDLTKIVGLGCQIQIGHYTKDNGNTSEDVTSVVMLPKGMPAPVATKKIIFDMDTDMDKLDEMPKLVRICVEKSRQFTAVEPEVTPFPDDQDLPF